MSTVVDSKVVEMTFDNKQFERETRNTMKTLDQLKKELDFDQSAKSLDKLNKAAQNVDFNGMGKAIDQVSVKLSAMEIIGTTALVNLTNKVVNAGERLVKSMTIDQVTDGWNKYAQKTEAVQTLLNSTGKSLNEINGYLETLQWYSDETSYGFTDMTQALSTMTIAGGKIEKLTPMIMGVANATAFAGKGAREFKSIMYNLSQSYSKGSLQTIDWKSVQLMGGASVQLKEALVQQAIALGKLKKGSTSKNFDQYLTDHVFTTDVMEAAFLQFSDYTEFVKEMVDKFGDSATDLNTEIIPTLVEAKKEGKEKLNEVVVNNNWEKYLPYLSKMEKLYDGLGKKAFLAAQEAKTFKEAIDATKDAVSSEFAKIFEAIFGDYYKAKKLWTDFVNWLYDLIVDPLVKLRKNITAIMEYSPVNELKKFAAALNKVEKSTKSTSKSLSYYQKMVNKIWNGDYNNQPYRKGLLEKEGHNFEVLQTLVNLGYQHKLTTEEVAAAEKKYGKGIVAVSKNLEKLSDDELKNLGLTEDQVKMYREIQKEAKKAGLSVKDYVNEVVKASEEEENLTGRDLFIGMFTNIGNALTHVLFAIREAFGKAFSRDGTDAVKSAYNVLYALYSITKKISDFFDPDRNRYDENGKEIEGYTNNYKNLVSTLKGLFSILSLIATVMKIGLKIAFGVVQGVLKAFGFTLEKVLEITGAVGETVFKVVKFIEKSIIGTVIDTIVDILVVLIDVIVELLTYSNPLFTFIGKIKNAIINFFKAISKWVGSDKAKKLISDVGKVLSSVLRSAISLFGKAISKTIDWITHNKTILSIVNGIRTAFSNAAKAVKDWIKSGEAGNAVAKAFTYLGKALVWVINTIAKGITATIEWAKNNKTLQKIVKTLGEYLSKMFRAIGNWLSRIDFVGIFNKIVKTISNLVTKVKNWIVNNTKLVEGLKSVWEWLKKSAEGFATWFSGIKDADNIPKYIIQGLVNGLKSGFTAVFKAIGSLASGILSTFAKILGIHSPSIKFFSFGINIVRGLMDGIENILPVCLNLIKTLGESIISVFKNLDIGTVLATIITIGAVATITKVAKALENFSKPFAAISGILGQVKNTVIEFNKTLAAFKVELYSQAVKNIATAILILAGAIFILTKIKAKDAWIAVGMIATLLAAIAAVILAIGYMSSKQNVKQFGLFAGTLGALAILVGAIGTMAIKLAIALKLMDGLQNTTKNMITLFAPIIGLLVIVGIIVALSKKFGANNELFKISAVFKAVSALMSAISKMILTMAIAMKIVGGIKPERFEIVKEFLRIVLSMLIIVVALVVASTQLKDSDAKKLESLSRVIKSIGTMVLALSVAVLILSKLTEDKWRSGALRMGIILGMIVLFYMFIVLVNKIGDKGVKKTSMDALSKMIGSIALLAIVVGILGLMSAKTIRKGLFALGILMLFVAALYGVIAVINHFTAKKGKGDASQAIIKVAMSIAILAAAVIILGLIDANILKKGMTVVILLGLLVAGLMYCASLIKKGVEKAIISIAAILAILAISVLVLGNMNPKKLIAGTVAMIALMVVLGSLLYLISKLKISKPMAMNIVMIGGIIAALGAILFMLAFHDWKKTLAAAGALTLVIVALAGVLYLVSKVIKNVNKGQLATSLIALGVLVVLMMFLATSLGKLASKSDATLEAAGALSLLLVAMTGVLLILGKVSGIVKKALIGVLGLVALTVVLIGIAYALSIVSGIPNAIEVIKKISLMLVIMTGVLAALAVIGLGGPAALIGVGSLLALIAAIVLVAEALGTLIKDESKLTKGLDLLVLIAKKVGEAMAAFVGAILDMVLSLLPKLGTALSKFAISAKPFIAIMKTINTKVLSGIGILTSAIVALGVANVINTITRILSLGGSFADLGKELSRFAKNSKDFIEMGESIPENLADNMLKLAKAVLAITAADILDKISSFFFGGSAIENFSNNLPLLGEGLRNFREELGDYNDTDVKTVECASNAIKKLSDATKSLPKSGGIIGFFTGKRMSMKDFSNGMESLGKGLCVFRKQLGNKFNDDDVTLVDKASSAIERLTDAAKAMPTTGGEWQEKFGERNMDAFGKGITSLGKGLKDFRDSISGFTDSDMKRIKTGSEMIATFAESAALVLIHTEEFDYTEDKDGVKLKALTAFAKSLKGFGTGLTEFYKELPSSKNMSGFKEKTEVFKYFATYMNAMKDFLAEARAAIIDDDGEVVTIADKMSDSKTTIATLMKSMSDTIITFNDKIKNVNFEKVNAGITAYSNFIKSFNDIKSIDATKQQQNSNKIYEFINNLSSIMTALLDKDKVNLFSESLNKLGEDIMGSIAEGISNDTSKSKIITNMLDALASVFDAFRGKSFIDTVVPAFLASLGTSIVSSICDGISSDTSKKMLYESLDTISSYLQDRIKEIKFNNIPLDDLTLTLSKIEISAGGKDEAIKKELKEKINNVFADLLRDVELGKNLTLNPVIDANVSLDTKTMSNLGIIRDNNIAMTKNVEALKNAFGTDLSKQTDRIVEKLGSVEKAINSIDGANYTYTVNIDSDTMNGNADVKNAFNSLVKALNINKKSG